MHIARANFADAILTAAGLTFIGLGARALWLEVTDLLKLREEEMRTVRGRKIAFVFQDPMTSLNPVKKIGEHFEELIRTHEPKTSSGEALKRAERPLGDVGIQPERINDYPHQLSRGGCGNAL